jgi:hypothetical protein
MNTPHCIATHHCVRNLQAVCLVILLGLACAPLAQAEPSKEPSGDVSYAGKWKWLTGQYKDRDPGSVTGVVVREKPDLLKARFKHGKETYNCDFKAETNNGETLLTGGTEVRNKPYTFKGTLAKDGTISGQFSNGTDNGEMTLTVSKSKD